MNGFLNQFLRMLPAAGFSVLSAFCGVGLTWLLVAFSAHTHSVGAGYKLLVESMPILVAGGVVGAIVGLVVSLRVLKMDPKREAEIEERHVENQGVQKLYLGVPAFILVLLAPLLRYLGHIVGQNADVYVALGVALVVVVLSLVLYGRIRPRLVIPLGVIAWMLAFSLVWFYMYGPGASLFRDG